MADLLDLDLASAPFLHGVDQGLWRLRERLGDVLLLEFTAADAHVYLMRLDCQDYGTQPIGGQFVDPGTGQASDSAWPHGNATFSQWVKFTGEVFICWDQDRYGIQRHPDWSQRQAWITATPNQLVSYATFIARLTNSPSMGYEHRAKTAA